MKSKMFIDLYQIEFILRLKHLKNGLNYEYKLWKRRKKKRMPLEKRRTTVLNRRNAFEASIIDSQRDVVLFQTVKRITPVGL
jgi:hypothetical protein